MLVSRLENSGNLGKPFSLKTTTTWENHSLSPHVKDRGGVSLHPPIATCFLSLPLHPTICGALDVLSPPPASCPRVVVSWRATSGSAFDCTRCRAIGGWQPYRSRWQRTPGSVSSDNVGYCKLVFTSRGNACLACRWVPGHSAEADRGWESCTFLLFRGKGRTPKERGRKERGVSPHPTACKE